MYYGFIYITTNLVNGKRYIGQTTKREESSYLGSGRNILAALKKYGTTNFHRETLAYAFSKSDLDFLERYFITEYDAIKDRMFYNIVDGGNSTKGFSGKKHTQEAKDKIKNHLEKNHPNRGKTFSDEVRKNMSAAKIGNKSKSTPEGREQTRQLGLANRGRKRTKEQVAMMSQRMKERPSRYRWVIQTPAGQLTVDKLTVWCREHGVTYTSLMNTLRTGIPHGKTGFMILERIKLSP